MYENSAHILHYSTIPLDIDSYTMNIYKYNRRYLLPKYQVPII